MKTLKRHNAETQSKLRSGVAITSVTQCVEELVTNSVDACASNVSIVVDLSAVSVEVSDNGCGFAKEELELAGNRYSTSKCSDINDFRTNLNHYGYRGEALASIADVSAELRIITCAKEQIYSKTLTHDVVRKGPVFVDTSSKNVGSGTTVTSTGLFFAYPVRYKSLDPSLELANLWHALTEIALINYNISFSLHEKTSGFKKKIKKNENLTERFSQLFGATCPLQSRFAEREKCKITVYFSRRLLGDSSQQFVYVNKRLVLSTPVHSQMKEIIKKMKSHECHEQKKQLYSYPVFVVTIECRPHMYDVSFDPRKTFIEFCDWQLILTTIQSLFVAVSNTSNSENHSMSDRENLNVAVDLVCVVGRAARMPHQEVVNSNDMSSDVLMSSHSTSNRDVRLSTSSLEQEKVEDKNANNDILAGWVEKFDAKLGKIYVNVRTGHVSRFKPITNQDEISKPKSKTILKKFDLLPLPFKKRRMEPMERSNTQVGHCLDCLLGCGHSDQIVFSPDSEISGLRKLNYHSNLRATEVALSKTLLQNIQVVGQVDKKFIACVTKTKESNQRWLLLFDQHAVHERIRLETYMKDTFEGNEDVRRVKSKRLSKILKLKLEDISLQTMKSSKQIFYSSGLNYDVESDATEELGVVNVTEVPLMITNSSDTSNVENILRDLIKDRTEAFIQRGTSDISLSPVLLNILCSKACHGAIRFGDELSIKRCGELIDELSRCKLPFQCAHGRPSVSPILGLGESEAPSMSVNIGKLSSKLV